MRTKLSLTALVVLAVLAFAGTALAAGGNGKARGHGNGKVRAGVRYAFVGTLTATPADGSLSLAVSGGNRAALRLLVGQSADQTFAYGNSTEFLDVSSATPAVVQPGDLAAGDVVRVAVRAGAGASLTGVEQRPATLVSDRGSNPSKPTQPLYTFSGTLASVGDGTVTIDVKTGNRRAMRLLIGQGSSQTFATGDQTVFLLWQGRVPTAIDASKLVVGDRVVVRVRADQTATLAQVEATAAAHVGDHERKQSSSTTA